MGTLDDVNRLAASGMSEFRIQSYDGWRLTIIGSSDLCYYHDIEVTFTDVAHVNAPTALNWPTIDDAGECRCCSRRRFSIRADEGEWEITAREVKVVIGKGYHYDRGDQLKPDERIADWVRLGDAHRTA